MGRRYSAQVDSVAVSAAAQDIFEVAAPSDSRVRILGWHLMQTSDLGDAEEEVLRVETVRGVGSVTSGSGGSVPTVQALDDNDAAAGTTVEANNTTQMAAGSGSLETLEQFGWNVRIPWTHYYTPETQPVIAPSAHWTLALPDGPADAITLSATLWLEEE